MAAIVSPLHDILQLGISEKASDWHIREGSPVALRIAGKLQSVDFITTKEYLESTLEIIASKQNNEDYINIGDADFALQEEGIGRFRVNLHRQRGLISMTLRHVKDKVPDLNTLGLPSILLDVTNSKNGIIFVTGSTGSGKSTTLACMIEHMNATMSRHIITIEDPIEYNFEDKNSVIEQREVGLDTSSFDSALRHALRQDPDVIVVGELRNKDSFESALTASETGHLVMTTLHTSTAAQSIQRILDFYPNDERESVRKALSDNLRAIICQRLVPKAIEDGLVPINEILINTPIVTKLLFEGNIEKLDNAIEGGDKEGMQSFNHALLELVNEGTIDENTALQFSSNSDALKMNLKGIFLSDGGGIIG